tara:strand:+ start:167 stop:538 length:372 start_codon:yes stop_codon:yes gene_type:complete
MNFIASARKSEKEPPPPPRHGMTDGDTADAGVSALSSSTSLPQKNTKRPTHTITLLGKEADSTAAFRRRRRRPRRASHSTLATGAGEVVVVVVIVATPAVPEEEEAPIVVREVQCPFDALFTM